MTLFPHFPLARSLSISVYLSLSAFHLRAKLTWCQKCIKCKFTKCNFLIKHFAWSYEWNFACGTCSSFTVLLSVDIWIYDTAYCHMNVVSTNEILLVWRSVSEFVCVCVQWFWMAQIGLIWFNFLLQFSGIENVYICAISLRLTNEQLNNDEFQVVNSKVNKSGCHFLLLVLFFRIGGQMRGGSQ